MPLRPRSRGWAKPPSLMSGCGHVGDVLMKAEGKSLAICNLATKFTAGERERKDLGHEGLENQGSVHRSALNYM